MGSYPDEFPFNIMDVVELLRLRVRRQQSNSVYVDCPFCGDRRGKMNVNFVKNVWRCNYCGEHGRNAWAVCTAQQYDDLGRLLGNSRSFVRQLP